MCLILLQILIYFWRIVNVLSCFLYTIIDVLFIYFVVLLSMSCSSNTIKEHLKCNRGRPSFIILNSSVLSHWPCILPCTLLHRSCTGGRRRSRSRTTTSTHALSRSWTKGNTEKAASAATVTSSTCSTLATWTWCYRRAPTTWLSLLSLLRGVCKKASCNKLRRLEE